MTAQFEDYLRLNTSLTGDEIIRITASAEIRKLRRGEFLFQEGEICRHKVFVLKGLLRIFSLTPDGSEHILQFTPESNWTLDAESYDLVVPSKYNIDAIEASEIMLWTKADFINLLTTIPGLKSLSEQLISRNTYRTRQQLLLAISASPEQKYERFVLDYPDLLHRLPLRMIAAYLGMSLKTLNRVRHAQLLR
jgi:CRP/FNR family transcriptional regulator, anaerobic regulatory protein